MPSRPASKQATRPPTSHLKQTDADLQGQSYSMPTAPVDSPRHSTHPTESDATNSAEQPAAAVAKPASSLQAQLATRYTVAQYTAMLATFILAVHRQHKNDAYKAFAPDFFSSLLQAREDEPALPTERLIELHSAAWKDARGIVDESTSFEYAENVGLRIWQQKMTKLWLQQQPADTLQWVNSYCNRFATTQSVDV